jgi:hypothetical protein
MDRTCEYCGQPIEGLFITTLGGQAHKRCYLVRHPYRQAKDFAEALAGDDRVLLRHILDALIPVGLKSQIVQVYNAELLDRYKRALAG